MKVVVAGSRTWTNEAAIERELRKLPTETIIIHGGCPTGADALADRIARGLGFEVRVYRAQWDLLGRGAGPVRNSMMLESEKPIDLLLAFARDLAGSRGTSDVVFKAKRRSIRVEHFEA